MVSDLESGKPRGFAFVEFEDPQAALAAIRNMNDYELNGRRLRVNFSNSSHLETLAGQLGMDLTKRDAGFSSGSGGAGGTGGGGSSQMGMNNAASGMGGMNNNAASGNMNMDVGTQAVSNALKNMSKGEMYDVVAKLKQIADMDPDEARKIISGHPQLPEALLFLMSQLDMIRAPLSNGMGSVGVGVAPPAMPGMGMGMPMSMPMPMPPMNVPPPPPVMDPRGGDPRARQDPRAAAADPRAAAIDPRRAMQVPPASMAPPPPYRMGGGGGQQQPPPHVPVPPPQPMGGVAGLDPALVQQVMGLTPAQIAQLPVEKQSSILALRQQITNAMGGGH